MHSEHIDKEYAILENIYHQPAKVRQRDLAHVAGISLGMTNAILKRLVGKGLVIASKINHRNIQYAVTPTGIHEIMRRSYRYFKRTIKNIVYYKEKILALVRDIRTQGYDTIALIGESDLDFIIEHCAQQEGLSFQKNGKTADADRQATWCYVLSEKKRGAEPRRCKPDIVLYDYLN
jgi:DNA-binding MarR family transcriptional regulator